jgi:tripartite-type tricarboxylate transporter receptor subunit TctC
VYVRTIGSRHPEDDKMHRPGTLAFFYAAALALCAGAFTAAGGAIAAEQYPGKPIRLIVPYPAGGPTDLMARAINERLGERLGQPIVVDNRGGGATIIGAELAARAPADGYTLLLGTTTLLVVNPVLNKNLPYRVDRDYAPVSMLGDQAYLLAAPVGQAFKTVGELVAYARSYPGKLSYGSAGIGSAAHFAGEMLKHAARIDIVHIPYKGTAPAIADLVGGHIHLMFGGVSAMQTLVGAGKLHALAVSTAKRSSALPNIPTIAESGIPDFEISSWNAILVPRGTPERAIDRLNAEIRRVMDNPDVRQRLRQQGIDISVGSPAELSKYIEAERLRFSRLIAAIGPQLQ